MKIELPLIEKTSLISYPDVALAMPIMMTIPNIENWLVSEFIQLHSNSIFIKYYNYGSAEEYEPLETTILRTHLDLGEDIIDVIKNFIKNEYYIIVLCDDSCIPILNIKYSRLHSILLFGYDDDKQKFDAYAYHNGKPAKFKILYKEFLNAYNSKYCAGYEVKSNDFDGMNENDDVHRINCESNLLVLYKIKELKFDYINIEKFKWHMLDYMEAVNTVSRERPHLGLFNTETILWGMDIYTGIKKFYNIILDRKYYINHADAYCLYEHKKNMLQKMIYLGKHTNIKCDNNILNDYNRIVEKAEIFMNLVIKYNYRLGNSDVTNTFNNIISCVDFLEYEEKQVLYKFYEENKSVFNDT